MRQLPEDWPLIAYLVVLAVGYALLFATLISLILFFTTRSQY